MVKSGYRPPYSDANGRDLCANSGFHYHAFAFERASQGALVNPPPDIAMFDCTLPCPICNQRLELSAMETVPWSSRTSGERLVFRCGNCGMAQTRWRAVPLVSAPEIVPEGPTFPASPEPLPVVSPQDACRSRQRARGCLRWWSRSVTVCIGSPLARFYAGGLSGERYVPPSLSGRPAARRTLAAAWNGPCPHPAKGDIRALERAAGFDP
jgi:hypothetical protein